jgi:HEAT repeat protein
MRTKVLLAVTLLALLILLPAIYYRNTSSSPPPGQADDAQVVRQDGADASTSPAPPAKPAATPRTLAPIRPPALLPSTENAADASPAEHQAYVIQRRAELLQMGMSDDPAALKTILSELNNQDPEIRKTALAAAVDFGSLDAIPALKNQLAWTDDLQEKMDITKAIEFLQLPPARPNSDGAPITQQGSDAAPAAESN